MANKILLFVFIVMMAGCALPPYVAPAENVVTLNIKEVPNPWICVESERYALKVDGEGNVKVPAGDRIVIGSNHSWSGYNVTYSCEPSISFIPNSEISYFANWEIIDEACRIEIYRITDKNRIGLDFEPSFDRGWCQTK